MRAIIEKGLLASVLAFGLVGVAHAQGASAGASTTVTTTSAPSEATWTIGVEPRLGLNLPTSKLDAFGVLGLELDFRLPVLHHKLAIALDGSITRPSFSGTNSTGDPRVGGAYSWTIHETEVKVGLDAVYRFFGDEHHLVPFVGAGPLIHMLRTSESTSFAPGDNTNQDTKIGFEAFAGVDFKLGPGYLVGDARFVYSSLNHQLTGGTNAGNVSIDVGYRLTF